MRSVNANSAASLGGSAWDQVDWPIVHRRVRGLQIRIAKATLVDRAIWPRWASM